MNFTGVAEGMLAVLQGDMIDVVDFGTTGLCWQYIGVYLRTYAVQRRCVGSESRDFAGSPQPPTWTPQVFRNKH